MKSSRPVVIGVLAAAIAAPVGLACVVVMPPGAVLLFAVSAVFAFRPPVRPWTAGATVGVGLAVGTYFALALAH